MLLCGKQALASRNVIGRVIETTWVRSFVLSHFLVSHVFFLECGTFDMQNALHNQRLFGWTNLRLGHTYWVSPETYQQGKVCRVNLEYISNEVIYVGSEARWPGCSSLVVGL